MTETCSHFFFFDSKNQHKYYDNTRNFIKFFFYFNVLVYLFANLKNINTRNYTHAFMVSHPSFSTN